jgi:hypothetical protein
VKRRHIKDTFPEREHLESYYGHLAAICGTSNDEIEVVLCEQVSKILAYWFQTGQHKSLFPWVTAAEEVARVVVGLLTSSELQRQIDNESVIVNKLFERLSRSQEIRMTLENAVKLVDEWRPGVFDFRLQMGGEFVYALFDGPTTDPNYIGETINLFARLTDHYYEKEIPFTEFAVLQCGGGTDRKQLEKMLIEKFDPPYNKKHAGRGYGKVAA